MSLNIKRRQAKQPLLMTSLHPKIAQIYANRGITDATQLQHGAANLLHYSHLDGINTAIDCLLSARDSNKKVMVVGDFDADGATSTALMLLALPKFGFQNVGYIVPNRFEYGYGLSPEIVELVKQQHADVIVTVDNGISSHAGVERANEFGMQVVITDHHLPPEKLPAATAIVNPNLQTCAFPSKHLAGVGVAFYLLLALRARLEQDNWFEHAGVPKPNIADFLDLVALGTVADVVPLDHNNRVLVYQGLQRIRSGRCRPGIRAMLANKTLSEIQASDMGFVVGPRLNAAGRLQDMSIGIQCLLAENEAVAAALAQQLEQLNKERREIEADMQQDAVIALAETNLAGELPAGIALYKPDWHQGIVGILAGRVKDKHHRPTFAFARQDGSLLKGSGRAIAGLHLKDLLEEMNLRYPGLLLKYGGHAAAAGLTIAESDFQQFAHIFADLCQEMLAPELMQSQWLTDGELGGAELELQFAELLRQAGPFGQGFPEPQFDGEFNLEQQRIVGAKHLKMVLRTNDGKLLDAIAFNVDLEHWPNQDASKVQLVYKLDVNEFRGRRSVQLIVDALAATH